MVHSVDFNITLLNTSLNCCSFRNQTHIESTKVYVHLCTSYICICKLYVYACGYHAGVLSMMVKIVQEMKVSDQEKQPYTHMPNLKVKYEQTCMNSFKPSISGCSDGLFYM